jgi:putative flippase GtrA
MGLFAMKNTALQTIRFLAVGIMVVVFNVVLLYSLTSFLGIWYLVSSVIAYILAVLLNFSLQKWWVFDHGTKGSGKQQFSLYAIVSLGYLALNTLSMYVLVDRFHVLYLFAQAGITLVLSVINFWINKTFVFKKEITTLYE